MHANIYQRKWEKKKGNQLLIVSLCASPTFFFSSAPSTMPFPLLGLASYSFFLAGQRQAVLQLNHCSKALPLQTILKLSWLSKASLFPSLFLILIVGRIRALGVESLQKTKRWNWRMRDRTRDAVTAKRRTKWGKTDEREKGNWLKRKALIAIQSDHFRARNKVQDRVRKRKKQRPAKHDLIFN